MASAEKLIRIILSVQDNATKEFEKAASAVEKMGNRMKSVGDKMSLTVTAPLVAAGAAGVKMAMDLDREMRNIQSISKQTDAEIASLSDTFLKMSTDMSVTTDSAIKLAQGFYDIQGSGFEGADAMKVLEAATKAATAGLTDTQVAAEGIAAVLNSYGKSADEATQVSDLMFRTVDRGVGSFEELTSSMANVVGTASTMDVDFAELSAAIATMSKQGLSFSEATVSMNQALTELLRPSDALQQALTEMGYASGQALIDAKGLGGAIQELERHTGGSAEEMANLFGNVRSLRAVMALTGSGADMFAEDLAAMAEANGATAEAFATQTKSFEATFKNFMNTLNAFLITAGQAILPALTNLMKGIMPILNFFISLPEPIQTAIVAFLALVAAIGPVLSIAGSIMSAWGAITAVFTTLTTILPAIVSGFMTLAPAVWAALAPIAPFILAVGALVAALHFWDKTNTTEVWRTNFAMLGEIVEKGSQKIGNTLDKSANQWGKNFDMLGTILEKLKTKAVQVFASIMIKVKEGLSKIVPAFQQMGTQIMQGLITGVTSKIAEFISTVKNIASQAANAVKNALGIRSPSRVMAKLGEQTVAGFQKGIESMGGIGVNVNGASLAPSGMSPQIQGNGGSSGFGGGNVFNVYAAPGTTDQQVDEIARKLAKRVQKRL